MHQIAIERLNWKIRGCTSVVCMFLGSRSVSELVVEPPDGVVGPCPPNIPSACRPCSTDITGAKE